MNLEASVDAFEAMVLVVKPEKAVSTLDWAWYECNTYYTDP